MMTKVVEDDLIYYYSSVVKAASVKERNDFTKFLFASIVIDKRNNTFLKCRNSLEEIVDLHNCIVGG